MTITPVSLEEVLEALAAEPQIDRPILERYLRGYPQFADDIIDFSHQAFLFSHEDDGPLMASDQMRIDSALSQFHQAAARMAQPVLASIPPERQRALANNLGVPRQVILGFMERAIVASSVPAPFLRRLAQELNDSTEDVFDYLSQPRQTLLRAAKATDKPRGSEQVPFERMLRDAGVAEADIARLLIDDE